MCVGHIISHKKIQPRLDFFLIFIIKKMEKRIKNIFVFDFFNFTPMSVRCGLANQIAVYPDLKSPIPNQISPIPTKNLYKKYYLFLYSFILLYSITSIFCFLFRYSLNFCLNLISNGFGLI